MDRKLNLISIGGLILGFIFFTTGDLVGQEVKSQRLVVDDNKVECPEAEFSSIQSAVDAATNGAVVKICAGTYNEQIIVNKSIHVIGEKQVVIKPKTLSVNAKNLAMEENLASVFHISQAAGVVIEELTIDGIDHRPVDSSCLMGIVGISCEDSSAQIREITVQNLERQLNQNQECADNGIGIFIQSSDTGESDVTVENCEISKCPGGGIIGHNLGTRVRAKGNVIANSGSNESREGVQLMFGAVGTIQGANLAGLED